jgi:hypothetical protein
MSAVVSAPPELLFDLDAPAPRVAPPPRERTLDELIAGTWNELGAHRTAACPMCGGALAPRYGAGSTPVGGRCRDCNSTLG